MGVRKVKVPRPPQAAAARGPGLAPPRWAGRTRARAPRPCLPWPVARGTPGMAREPGLKASASARRAMAHRGGP